MTSNKELILEGLKTAIQAEGDGHVFYLMAAKSTEDEKGKEIFLALAEEEQNHLAFLKAQYKALKETGTIDPNATLGPQHTLSGDSPIFSDNLKARIGDAHFEMTSLSVGVQLEKNAIAFYQEQADIAEDPQVKDFYKKLVDWERGHYEALLAQQEALKEDYWNESGFSPF